MNKQEKPIKAKPSFYAHCFYFLKEIALKYGYNLVLHGSMDRDLDLIAIPWEKEIGDCDDMLKEFAEYLGGELQRYGFDVETGEILRHTILPQGRKSYVIDLNRMGRSEYYNPDKDPQWYVDISVTPNPLA